ncbi:MAG: AbrB/MazE/SpoVT family DNA-binding domain-containing protein [Chloroflexota bacterium]
MSTPARLLPVEDDGRVMLPADLRAKLGLKQGDLVSVIETPEGLLLTSRQAAVAREIEQVDAEIGAHGVSLDELIESGRELRGELLKELYGIDR